MSDKLTLLGLIERLERAIERIEATEKPSLEIPEDQAKAIEEFIERWRESRPVNMDEMPDG